MNQYTKEQNTATEIAKQAGKIMLEYFDGDQQTRIKSDGSPVTIADTKINSLVIKLLKEAFPDDGVIGEEESTTDYGMGRKWFCDPIDGTKGYTWGTPTAMFSLGLVVDGRPQVGVVYDPFLDRMYTSIKSEGSYCNGKPLAVSMLNLQNGIVAISSSIRKISEGVPAIKTLASMNVDLANFSGAVYKSTLVARGRFVGYFESEVNGHDMAAIELIVEEAGGKVTGFDGRPLNYSQHFEGAVVSNGIVHDELVKIISK